MTVDHPPVAPSKPRWDGSRILFEIDAGGERIRCAISRSALHDLSGRKYFATTDLIRCFVNARTPIERIARRKFEANPESASGIISIWSDDIDDPTPDQPAAVALEQAAHTRNGHA